MNRFVYLTLLAFIALASTVSCGVINSKDDNSPGSPDKLFATSAAAAQKGKNDLLALVNYKEKYNISLNRAEIEKSTLGQEVEVYDVIFPKLLNAEEGSDLAAFVDQPRGILTPLVVDSKTIGAIETKKEGEQWALSAISNPTAVDDLNKIGANRASGKIKYYEIPNINARVYAVSVEGNTQYFTNYKDFNYEKPVSMSELLPTLREDAQRFDQAYGKILKEKKLVE